MPSQSSPDIPRQGAPAGGETEGLSLRLRWRVLRRCLPMLQPVRADLLRFAMAVALLGILGTSTAALLLDLHWTRVLTSRQITDTYLLARANGGKCGNSLVKPRLNVGAAPLPPGWPR